MVDVRRTRFSAWCGDGGTQSSSVRGFLLISRRSARTATSRSITSLPAATVRLRGSPTIAMAAVAHSARSMNRSSHFTARSSASSSRSSAMGLGLLASRRLADRPTHRPLRRTEESTATHRQAGTASQHLPLHGGRTRVREDRPGVSVDTWRRPTNPWSALGGPR
jgi:hypothetical protein